MSHMIAEHLKGFATLPKFYLMMLASTMSAILTQFASNVAVANVILPVLAEMSVVSIVNRTYK